MRTRARPTTTCEDVVDAAGAITAAGHHAGGTANGRRLRMRTSHTSLARRALIGASTLTLMFFGIGVASTLNPAAASASPVHGYTCAGGNPNAPTPIPPGSYSSMTVTGVCFVAGAAQVTGGLTIAPNAVLLATDSPGCAHIAHLDVSGGISVQSNAILFLGDSNNR